MSVWDLLAEEKITFKRRNYGDHHMVCPKCGGGRTKELSLSVTVDAESGVWICHRAKCGWTGSVRMKSDNDDMRVYRKREKPTPVRPSFQPKPDLLPKNVVDWFAKRKISRVTLDKLGISFETVWMPGPNAEVGCIAFPYTRDGEVINVKYRDANKHFRQEKNAEKILYGMDWVPQDADTLIWVEGEGDLAACHESGICNVVSVPDGAPSQFKWENGDRKCDVHKHITDPNVKVCPSCKATRNMEFSDETDVKFEYVWNCHEFLGRFKKHILAFDDDAPGRILEDEISRRLGREICWRVRWPQAAGDIQIKDANEALIELGEDGLRECIDSAEPYPVRSLFNADHFGDAVIKLYRDGRSRGLSTGFTNVDRVMTIRPGELSIVTGYPSSGKALAIDTQIPTPNGWTTMGDIKTGDLVFDENGRVCNVTAVTDVMLHRQCYKITFTDGSTVVCDAEHLWYSEPLRAVVSNRNNAKKRCDREFIMPRGTDQSHKRARFGVYSTRQIADDLVYAGKFNHRIPLAGAMDLPEADLPIGPYTLGAWLGDGSSRFGFITNVEDPDILDFIKKDGYEVRSHADGRNFGILGLSKHLSGLNLIKNKHIPNIYHRSSRNQRLELLRGLMDTDGHCSKDGHLEYTSISENLACDVLELMLGLGIKATMNIGDAVLNGKFISKKYRVIATTDIRAFNLERKYSRQRKTNRTPSFRAIEKCELIESVPVKCIAVDSPSRLYLCTRNFIPTHNSEVVDSIAVNMSIQHGWKFAICSFENPPDEHIAKWSAKYMGLPFYDGPHQRMDENQLRMAMRWLNDRFFLIRADDESPTMDWVLEKAKVAVMRYGINGLILDPYNEFEHQMRDSQTETRYISDMLGKIKRFAQSYGVHVWFVAHPAKPQKDQQNKAPTLYDISGGANWNNKADIGFSVHRPFLDDGTRSSTAEVHVLKVRFRACGEPGVVRLEYQPGYGGRYTEVD